MNKTRLLFLVPLFLLAGLFAYNWYINDVTVEYGTGTYRGQASLGRIVWNGVPHGQGTFSFGDYKFVGEFKDYNSIFQRWNGTNYDKDGNVTATYSEGVMTEK